MFVMLSLTTLGVSAQSKLSAYFKTSYYDFAAAVGSKEAAGAISWQHLHGLGAKKKFKIGYGLRAVSYFGSSKNYSTAPAKYTIDENKIDTVFISNAQSNFINISIQLAYSIKKVDLGFNIDAAG